MCVPSLFLLLFGMFAGDVFLSFFLSQALGKPKPRLGFGFTLVYLLRGRGLRPRPGRPARHLPLGVAPAPVVFFFVPSSPFAGLVVVGCGLFGLSLFGGCFSGFVFRGFVLHAHVMRPCERDGAEGQDILRPCRIYCDDYFWGEG